MKYLCMIYIDENALQEAPADLVSAVARECDEHTEELRQEGTFLASERLQPTSTAITVRTRGDQTTVTDGPFAETKEQLAGFYLIDAADMDEAVRIASHIPPGRFGCVEARAVDTGPEA